jgi:hypothetical protein
MTHETVVQLGLSESVSAFGSLYSNPDTDSDIDADVLRLPGIFGTGMRISSNQRRHLRPFDLYSLLTLSV